MPENLNTTMNGIRPSSCYRNPTAENIAKTFAYCLIFLVSLAGNTVIGKIVYKTKTMRKPINFLIVNMAMSDMLFPIFWFPFAVSRLYTDFWLIGGPLGQALCKLVAFLPFVSIVVSIQSLVLIAVDRFGAVVYPLRSPFISSKLCAFFILSTWIVAMVIESPTLFARKLDEDLKGRRVCIFDFNEVFGESSSYGNYVVSLMVVIFFIPFVVMAILYIIIYLKLKTQKSPGEQSVNAGQQRQQRERNVLKMAIAIVLGFAVCHLPYCISRFLTLFALDMLSCGYQYFFSVAYFMSRANCAINPCICFIFSRNYREALKTLFR